MICSDRVARSYLQLIRHTLRRWRSHPMYDDLIGYATWKVFETLAHLRQGNVEEAFGVVALVARLAGKSFWRSQHCDPAWRGSEVALRYQEVPLAEAEDADQWLRRFIEPDFAPALIERLFAEGVWEELGPLLSEKEGVVVRRWRAGERISEIARDLGLAHQSTIWRLQSGLDRYRRRHGLPCRRLTC